MLCTRANVRSANLNLLWLGSCLRDLLFWCFSRHFIVYCNQFSGVQKRQIMNCVSTKLNNSSNCRAGRRYILSYSKLDTTQMLSIAGADSWQKIGGEFEIDDPRTLYKWLPQPELNHYLQQGNQNERMRIIFFTAVSIHLFFLSMSSFFVKNE